MVKKNTQRVFNRRVVYSAAFIAWERVARLYVREARLLNHVLIKEPVNMRALFYFKNHQSEPDLSALYEGIADVLEKEGVIENDRLIYGHDGSRKIFGEEPRIEVELWAFGAMDGSGGPP
jgi:Holliday junction resolvase RusA-like endonuclease